jgi:hypothetical protein
MLLWVEFTNVSLMFLLYGCFILLRLKSGIFVEILVFK